MKAYTTLVPFGNLQIDGVMFEDGTFGVTAQQSNKLLGFSNDLTQASKSLKRILGKDFKLPKVAFQDTTNRGNNKQTVIKLEDFERLLFELSLKGNKEAITFTRSLVGLSLTKVFSDAFGVKFDAENMQKYLKTRQQNKKQFHPKLTIWFKEDGCDDMPNGYLKRVMAFKAAIGLPRSLKVTEMAEEQLDHMNVKEIEYHAYRKAGFNHDNAISML